MTNNYNTTPQIIFTQWSAFEPYSATVRAAVRCGRATLEET